MFNLLRDASRASVIPAGDLYSVFVTRKTFFRSSGYFEKYLPYALALDVENEWNDKFADVLKKAGVDQDYSPSWYSGTSWNKLGSAGLVSSLGASFSSAISSSSTAPGSSSGSGGGGSSGGGGGGGGGGGW